MVDLSVFSHRIERGHDVKSWFEPVLRRGRDAAFVDTGFLRALLDERDERHTVAAGHFYAARTNFYTTSLVLAEAARQIAKHRTADHTMRGRMFAHCTQLTVDSDVIYVCSPDRDTLVDAYRQLQEVRLSDDSVDLCDALSLAVLQYANHNRIFGFDRHFNLVGGSLEPLGAR